MKREYGCQSMVAPLRKVLVRRPDEAFGNAEPVKWHYTGHPDLHLALKEHHALMEILRSNRTDVIDHNEPQPDASDAFFVHDPAIVTDAGAVILKMGKELRRGEEDAMASKLETEGVPIHRKLTGDARAEGGDLLWVDHDTLAVGVGFRTNPAGVDQLKEAMGDLGVEIVPVELPDPGDPESCLHLMSLVSIVDDDLAVIHRPLLPDLFHRYLQDRGFRFVDVPDEEFATAGPNVLALAPSACVMLEGNPVTKRRLEEAGCEVTTFRGNEICLKAEGGPTCLTRPILREY